MDVNGCLIISESSSTPEGWSSTVHRDETIRGPFPTIAQAVACAKAWNEEIQAIRGRNVPTDILTSNDSGGDIADSSRLGSTENEHVDTSLPLEEITQTSDEQTSRLSPDGPT